MSKNKLTEYFKEYEIRKGGSTIKIVDENDDFADVYPRGYGSDWYILTNKESKALNSGKVLIIAENGGEYQMFLRKKG